MYCEECSEAHETSAKYPGGELKYTPKYTPPKDPEPNKLPRKEKEKFRKCDCCKYSYKKAAVVKFWYQCENPGHNATYCVNCARQHQNCQFDYASQTIDSQIRFVEIYEKCEIKDKDEDEDKSDEDETDEETDDDESEDESDFDYSPYQ